MASTRPHHSAASRASKPPRRGSRSSAKPPTKPHKNRRRAPRRPFNTPTALLTVGGLGFLRPAPGSWGSLPPAALAFLLLILGVGQTGLTIAMAVLALAASVVCIYWGRYSVKRFGRKDAAEVVADETAGCALVFMFWPAAALRDANVANAAGGDAAVGAFFTALGFAVLGFGAFRAFDIAKPPPARRLEALPYGWGVLFDDLAAGAFALAAVQVVLRYLV
jgi:phosphatidylglycerophosphatase A